MVRLSILILLAGFVTAADDNPKAAQPPKEIYRVWIHSAEEDTNDVEVYRPEEYDFPPARGREGFEVKEKGVFIAHEIAPADGTDKIKGRWECKERGVLSVTFPDAKPQVLIPGEELPPPPPRTLRIVGCDKTILKLKKQPPGKG